MNSYWRLLEECILSALANAPRPLYRSEIHDAVFSLMTREIPDSSVIDAAITLMVVTGKLHHGGRYSVPPSGCQQNEQPIKTRQEELAEATPDIIKEISDPVIFRCLSDGRPRTATEIRDRIVERKPWLWPRWPDLVDILDDLVSQGKLCSMTCGPKVTYVLGEV